MNESQVTKKVDKAKLREWLKDTASLYVGAKFDINPYEASMFQHCCILIKKLDAGDFDEQRESS